MCFVSSELACILGLPYLLLLMLKVQACLLGCESVLWLPQFPVGFLHLLPHRSPRLWEVLAALATVKAPSFYVCGGGVLEIIAPFKRFLPTL